MKDYITLAMRTCSPDFRPDLVPVNLLHGAIGMSTEAGELLDATKKALFYGKPLDRTNIIEECGDILWYMAAVLDHYGVTIEEVQKINIDKLQKRYPEKFEQGKALERDLDAERKIMDANLDRFEKPVPAEMTPDQKAQRDALKLKTAGGDDGEPTY